MDYKYNELDYAELIYNNGFQTKHIPTELRLVATYMKTILNYKPKKLREEMYLFCSEKIPEYNRVKYYKIINRAINQASKKNAVLIKIDKIEIYDYEVDYINSLCLHDSNGVIPDYIDECKKVVFTLLCQMKLNQIISKTRNGKESSGLYFKGGNKKYSDLKKMANISTKVGINNDIMYALGQCGVITVMFNGLIKLNFIEELNKIGCDYENKTVALNVVNFDDIGWYFDYYNKVKNIKLCKYCSQPFRQTKKDILYCGKHKQYYIPQETKTIICDDCGKEVVVDARDMKTKRCTECTKIYRNSYQKELMRKRRSNC